jgi:hypothetical protein
MKLNWIQHPNNPRHFITNHLGTKIEIVLESAQDEDGFVADLWTYVFTPPIPDCEQHYFNEPEHAKVAAEDFAENI